MAATRVSIARLAGVSVATVDRVIRNDSAVRPETVERVQAALDSLRNTRASRGRPAKHTSIKVAFVMPVIRSKFVDKVERDIALSASFFREHRITPSFYRCDFSDNVKTAQLSESLRGYDSVVLLPLDYPWVDQFIDTCCEVGIPVITVFSDRPASRRALFLGADNRMMGRTAGLLMGKFTAGRSGTVIILSDSSRLPDQSERRTGFEQILEEDFKHLRWAVEPDFPTDEEEAYVALRDALPRYANVTGVYVTRDGAAGVAKALEGLPSESPVVFIGHGISDSTRALLTAGGMDVVLDQDSRGVVHAAGLAALNLVNDVRGLAGSVRQPIQIYFRENANA
ncbi:substrate-binding domain-containing protein [Pseudomonas sp. CCM 7891]|uniref:Substrate-binding domain-containing protein n=1 Tax=Pseudomonas karstica TaxID=1055468 RepID=A0A7X2RR92_9PSED|nr:LacI family DNA-binding transcriptional regulator [Pseudomonas karstica]MTD19636.1 substrate-binding domain-containing protein [Pseudomonas karstica]